MFFTEKPIGLRWRSSYWFTTGVIGFGIMTDMLVYSVVIPVLPFQLRSLGYDGVSGLVGWLLFAFSAGLVVSTIPIAMYSERYNNRTIPLNIGMVIMIGSQIMIMLAPVYWLMCLARVLQGIASSMVWVAGLALVCDVSPTIYVGRQLGLCMSGFSFGIIIGPSVGGALYERFGFHGPFIFAIIFCAVDLSARLLIIERHNALRFGFDPSVLPSASPSSEAEAAVAAPETVTSEGEKREHEATSATPASTQVASQPDPLAVNSTTTTKPLSLLAVIGKFYRSPRAVASLTLSMVFGIVIASQEPTLPLHVNDIWHFNSGKVGLIFLAASIPTLFATALSGWLNDKYGAEFVSTFSLLLALPWWILLIIEKQAALFIVCFAIENFFTSASIAPVMAELEAVARNIEGVGYAHSFGAFNLIYGVGSTIGPIIGGQIYDHTKKGWLIICLLSAGFVAVCLVLVFAYSGNQPLLKRMKKVEVKKSENDAAAVA